MVEPVERFLNFLTVEKGLSLNTLGSYRSDIQKFREYLDRFDKDITGFNKKDLIEYITHLRDTGCQTSTISRSISALRGLCKFMLMEGIIDEDPR